VLIQGINPPVAIPAATPNLAFYSTAFDQVYGSAAMPRTSGSLSMEMRFRNRIRVRESYETDSYHDNSSSTLGQLFYLSSGLAASLTTPYTGHLQVEQHRSQTELLVDVTKQLMVRGGYRYEWGSADVPSGLLSTTTPDENGQLVRHVALAGVKYRPTQRMVFNADMEISDGVKTFYRTGLQDYLKLRALARITLPWNLFLNLSENYLNNKNPDPSSQATFRSDVESASLQWMPAGSKRVSLIADYTHSEIRSDISYLVLFPYSTDLSLYVDNDRSVEYGSFVTTAGSRPSKYYQPLAKLLIPITPRVHLYAEWQWYELNQPFYLYEGFRAHTILSGVRFLM